MNHNTAQQVPSQKHLEINLNTKLKCQEYLNNVQRIIVNKNIRLMHNPQAFLLRRSLVKVCEAFMTMAMTTPSIKKWSQ